ncbi:MAG: hypothetical protein M3072_11380 [Candidatus Dormibacteraeota bacterium]|nr:hypothetical protein [Candidatus Dormibacteraeota bacterium]
MPFYRVDLAGGDVTRIRDVTNSLSLQHGHSTITSVLFSATTEGRVADPAVEPFVAWPTEQRQITWPVMDSAYLYSHHQLLGLRRARSVVSALQPDWTAPGAHAWRLDDGDVPSDDLISTLQSWRGLAVVLTALDTVYWPEIMQTVSHTVAVWRATRLEFDPADALSWLGVTSARVREQADQLRLAASAEDVLGDFYDIVRRAKSESWTTLRGEALTAMDDRVAADVLHRAVDENDAAAMEPYRQPLSQQWLRDRPTSLDAALNDLHLSPHPPLVVGVEGETEQSILPKVFALLGIRNDPDFIRIENFGGTKKDLSLLARFAAAPSLGEAREDLVTLDRPVTRFLVLTDAENKYATAAKRRRQRILLLNSITHDVPPDLRADLYGRPARMVEIRTWGHYPFEFAHFTDAQLADAMLTIATKSHLHGRVGLIDDIRRQRTNRSPNIEHAWPQSGIRKLQLADAYWPLLERRIERAIAAGTHSPLIMAAAVRAYELALLSYRRTMGLRRRRWRPPQP